MELRDKNGLTEADYLKTYRAGRYDRPSLAVDSVIIRTNDQYNILGHCSILLIQRRNHPFLGMWALPGGFVNKGEPAQQAATRELLEETGLENANCSLLGFYSEPGRDPRGWVVSAAYLSVLTEAAKVKAGDDAAKAVWFDLSHRLLNARPDTASAQRVEQHELAFQNSGVCFRALVERSLDCSGILPKESFKILSSGKLAFDHAQIILAAALKVSR